jgi:hypothetical protein
MKRWLPHLLASLVAIVVATGMGPAPSAVARVLGGFSATRAAGVGSACGSHGATPPKYRHVIWIWFENHAYDAVAGSSDAPFTNRLAAACGLATNYHNITHPSLPNYIAATSGGTQGISDDCGPTDCPRRVPSLFGQLQSRGLSWMAYQESMPRVCDLSSGSGQAPPGDYAPKHDPAVYYLALRTGCQRRVVPLGTPGSGAFAQALHSGKIASFSFITPNLCNDTHDCPVSTGDAWLSRWLPAITSSKTYRAGSTVIFVTWDEGEGGNTDDCATNVSDPGCHVVTIVVSPSTPHGTRSGVLFNHYSLLKTTEQLLGVASLGHAGDRGLPSMRAAFHL